MADEKISIEEYLEGDNLLDDDFDDDDEIFEDRPKGKDFTIFVLILVAVISIVGTLIYFKNALIPIDNSVTVSGEELYANASSKLEEYKNGKVNINAAGIEALCTLKSIGESKALSIISYREAHGEFKSIEEIKNVSGIGDGIFEKIKGYICI